MKIFVVTNTKGQVIGSSPIVTSSYPADAPLPGRPTPLRGQRVHEVELPEELQQIDSAVELHKHLKKLVAARRRPAKPAKKAGSGKEKSRSKHT